MMERLRFLAMAARLTLELSVELLDVLLTTGHLQIELAAPRRGKAGQARARKPGSLPARIIEWAKKRKRPFKSADIETRFKVSRAHASVLLARLANGPAVRRKSRGVYECRRR